MSRYFVYILRCNDNSYYTGVTNDIDRRLCEQENDMEPESYSKKRPIKLVFYEPFEDANQAIAFKKQIKGWNRKKKEAIINNNWELLRELSKRHT
jgi:putative endonuclease